MRIVLVLRLLNIMHIFEMLLQFAVILEIELYKCWDCQGSRNRLPRLL
jgi:hypothetical protein